MNRRRLVRIGVAASLLVATLSSPALACQDLPTGNTVLAVNLLSSVSQAEPGQEVELSYTFSHFGDPLLDPPFRTDGAHVTSGLIARLVTLDELPPEGDCVDRDNVLRTELLDISEGNPLVVDTGPLIVNYPEGQAITLDQIFDDPYSPKAVNPTGLTGSTTLTMPAGSVGQALMVKLHVFSRYPIGTTGTSWGIAATSTEACILLSDGPSETPQATFTRPLTSAEGGSAVPFEIVVDRGDYPAERPLRLVVERENPADPVDLFPIEPATLTADGVLIEGDEARVHMNCGLHFPCFVGMSNRLHLKLLDGDFVVYESRLLDPAGRGEAGVSEAPLAHLEVVAIDGSSEGRLQWGRDAEVLLRAYARNPAVGVDASLTDVLMQWELPEGWELLDHWLHHHDNPLDDVTPSRNALTANARLQQVGGRVEVSSDVVRHRFVTHPSGPPIFWDLLEADLLVRVPASALASDTLVVPGLEVTGQHGEIRREGSTEELVLPVAPRLRTDPLDGSRRWRPTERGPRGTRRGL
ncbi:MAG: hypothetical protein AAF533_03530 [Acidobacteriota bacterium]